MNGQGAEVLSRLRWQWQRLLEAMDHLNLLVLALCLLAAGLAWRVCWPLQQQYDTTQAKIAALQTLPRGDSAVKPGIARATQPAAPAPDLLTALPPLSQRELALRQLLQLADAQQVQTGRIQYSQEAAKFNPIQIRVLRLSIIGSPQALRKLLHEWLATMPYLAIRKLEQTQDAASGMTSLSLELALYFRTDLAQGAGGGRAH